ncbi:MAG: MCE family protein [Planctomycetes bacterium]|nr:MCE family protein [Planctomycetota bacterium]
MVSGSQKLRAGVFVLGCAVVAAGLVAVAAGARYAEDRVTHTVDFAESVNGLEKSSAVKFRGVRVGEVSEIRIPLDDPSKIRVTLRVDRAVPIYADARATLRPMGVTGLVYVEITGGTPDQGRLQDGGEMAAEPSFMASFTDAAASVFSRMDTVLASIGETLDAQARADLKRLLAALRGMAERNAPAVDRATDEVARLAAHMNRTLDRMDRVLERNESDLRLTVRDLRELARELRTRPSLLVRDHALEERELPE